MGHRSRGSGKLISRRKLLVGAGAVLTGAGLTSTGAFSSVVADRETRINETTDPNALLGIADYDTTSTTSITNNTNSRMDVTLNSAESVEFDVGTDGTTLAPPVTPSDDSRLSLAAGGSVDVGITFTGSCSNAGAVAVSSDGQLKDGSGNTIGSVSLTRDWKIAASGGVDITPNVSATGNSGQYDFELENTGCSDVTIVKLGINETTEPTAVKVGGKNNDGILTVGGTSVTSTVIPIDSTTPGSATLVDLNGGAGVGLNRDQTKSFSFDRVRDSRDGNAKMKGEDIKITIELSDGSTTVEKLCPNACSF